MTHLVHEVDQFFVFFFFNDTATTEIYTLSLHDALPISSDPGIEARTGFPSVKSFPEMRATVENLAKLYPTLYTRSEEHTSELQSRLHLVCRLLLEKKNSLIPLRPTYQICTSTKLPYNWT